MFRSKAWLYLISYSFYHFLVANSIIVFFNSFQYTIFILLLVSKTDLFANSLYKPSILKQIYDFLLNNINIIISSIDLTLIISLRIVKLIK